MAAIARDWQSMTQCLTDFGVAAMGRSHFLRDTHSRAWSQRTPIKFEISSRSPSAIANADLPHSRDIRFPVPL